MNYHEHNQVAAVYAYSSHYQHHSHLYPPQQPNPSVTPNPISSFNHHQSSLYGEASVAPPAALPPAVVSCYSYSDNGGNYAAQTTAYGGSYDVGTGGIPAYYHDLIGVGSGSVEVYGASPVLYPNPNGNIIPPNGAQQFVSPNFDHNLGTNQAVWHQKNNSKKRLKKTNIPLSVRCDVCKIVCDTQDVLDKHRLGKKHKKNLEKLKAVVAGIPTVAPNGSVNLVTCVEEAPDTSKSVYEQTNKKKTLSRSEDLETKRRKIMNCGTAIDSVKMCSVCDVVCNSETVFQSHLAGQKHASMLKKQASGTQPGLHT